MDSSPLTVQGPHGLTVDLGSVSTRQGADGAWERVITPPAVLPVVQVMSWLEQPEQMHGAAPLESGVMVKDAEAWATIAICMRWGSYLALMLDDNRPLWPAARKSRAHRPSRVSNYEMRRINLEVSSGLDMWLQLRDTDPSRYHRLIVAAVYWLKPHARVHPNVGLREGGSALFSLPIRPPDGWEQHPYRAMANALTLHALRNGPLEDVHAGTFATIPLQQRRTTPSEARRIIEQATTHLFGMLHVCDIACTEDELRDAPRDVQVKELVRSMRSPSAWSLTDHTAAVILRGLEPDE